MMLALDYDDTYTRDPIFWDAVIKLAVQRGHSVICATMRDESEGREVFIALGGYVEAIVFTDRKAKYKTVHEAGYMPSVWIDDSPHFIHMDALPRPVIAGQIGKPTGSGE
jgi:hypothetical protein